MQAVFVLIVVAVSCVSAFIDFTPCDPYPCKNGGTCIDLTYGKFKCKCKPGTTGKFCQTNPDDCAKTPNPCNEPCGKCFDGLNSFTCQCKPTMTGKNCEMGPCVNGKIKCQNGGTCTTNSKKPCHGFCKCAPDFTGNRCQTKIDDCKKAGGNPCNAPCGKCIDGINSFTCKCKPSMTGNKCEIGPCFNDKIKCLNGGTCNVTPKNPCDGFCKCAPDFTGKRCQTKINNCENKPCKCGRCMDGINSFNCVCSNNWKGPRCDQGGPCIPNPCKNGGKCSLQGCKPKCICTKWWKGPFCGLYN